jgi:hypothetical protein
MKSKRSKACDISVATKRKVWERDGQRCIICGNHNAIPNAHFIPRSKGGLGIEKNVVTLCQQCHFKFDQTDERLYIYAYIMNYLQKIYDYWSIDELIYKK